MINDKQCPKCKCLTLMPDTDGWADYFCRVCGHEIVDDTKRPQDEVKAALRGFVKAYEHQYPLRTADLHRSDCGCLRCAYDVARGALGMGKTKGQ